MSTVIVSASNDNFLPLAKGTWRSMIDLGLNRTFDLAWIDIGQAEVTSRWLETEASPVRRVALSSEVHEFVERRARASYHRALLLRPFLPSMFPEADVIIWIDSDIWIQEAETIRLFESAVISEPAAVAISPILDVAYEPLLRRSEEFIMDNVLPVWEELYGAAEAREYQHRPLFSNGLFAIAGGSDIWGEWATEVDRLFGMVDTVAPKYVHVAEQAALTHLLYRSGRFTALEAIHNFHANIGELRRLPDGTVTTCPPASRRVGAVHLSDIASHGRARMYWEAGLLYENGRDLSKREVEWLLNLRRS